MTIRSTLALVAGTTLVLAASACGSSPVPSSAEEEPGGTPSLGFADDDMTSDSPSSSSPESCVASSANAEPTPVFLVVLFDRSGSMTMGGSPKWASSKAAMSAFFSSPASKGLSASLTMFPTKVASCDAAAYAKPQVPMTALPDATFGQTLDANAPDTGATPTRPALEAAIGYARQIAEGPAKNGKVAVVLVTDGLPEHCTDNSVASVKQLAASVAHLVPTYVIGVGSALTNLDEIASGGGTSRALIIADSNAAQIQEDFLKAIESIRTRALACDYAIPAPPNGEQLETGKVNVVYKNGATNETLQYNQSCAGGTGWKYDDANNPTRILMCDGSCATIKMAGSVDVLFGCKTQTGPVK